MNEIKLYKVEEIAKLLDMHPTSVREYCKKGKLKAVKAGGKWLVTEEALKEFLRLKQN